MNFLLLNFIISLFFTALTTFFIGLFILIKGWKNKINRIFFFYTFSISWWAFFQALSIMADNADSSLFWVRVELIGVWFIPVTLVHFVINFLNLKNKEWVIRIGYLLSTFFALATFSDYMVNKATHRLFLRYWNLVTTENFFFHIAFAFWIIFTIYGFYELFRVYKISAGIKRVQLTYLFWATLVGFIGGGTNFILSYDIYIPFFIPFGNYFVGLYILAIAYAILKHQLMDIKLIIKRAFFYSIGIAGISGFVVGISFLSSWFKENVPGFQFWVVPALAGATTFIIGQLFWRKSKEADKLKYEFITVAAHKLRTPLTEVKWGLDAARDKNISEEERLRLIEKIFISNERLIETTNEILNISKSEDKDYVYKTETVDLKEITNNILKNFESEIKKKSIKLTTHFEKDLLKVLADKIRINSVIQILLENAILYTKDKIDIVIDSYEENILFHIEDNGIGISKEDQEYVFSKFYRSRGAYLSNTEGIGLGLHLAKNIIDKHNGKIGVKSEGEGKGSVFWFELKSYF